MTNCILFYNLTILSELIKEKEENNLLEEIGLIKQISPMAWQHINFMGRYEFNKPTEIIDIKEIVKNLKSLSFPQSEIPY